ncbi:MAG: YDG domain-containing protein, partial [Oscillospiraceae bacterium]|nr:YDG domain-containing protein [Oscillospiraceae bacterium]
TTLSMSCCTFARIPAPTGGGGVVRLFCTFQMSGGTISGNKAATNGGGVYVDGGTSSTFTVSGVSAVTGNTLSGVTTASNVYLPSGKYITLGELDESASIGVTAEAALSEGESVEITASENDNTAYYLTAADCFSSDNESYVVRTYTSASSSGNYLVLYYPITLTTSMLTVDAKEETYTGSEIEKDITSTLTLNTDYTVSYAYNIDAGEATITITGKGNYTGTLTYEFTINPATVTPSISGATTKIYDGTTTVTDDQNLTITLTGVVEGEDVTASAASYVYDSADAGEDILITASGITLGGEDKANYTLGNTTATANVGTIAQATPTLTLSDVTATKTYDGEAVSDPKVTVTLVNGEEYTGTPTITYYDESGTALDNPPADVGSYKVVVTISDAGANYKTVSSALDFEIIEADMTAEITGFNVPYDGEAHEVTVAAEDGATVTVTYTNAAGEAVTAPTEAGTYTAHVTVTKTGYTTIEQDVTVTITVSSQAISYETAKVTKTATDGTFTNPLTQTTVFGKITYTSSNTDVATVDESGQVTIIGVGTATITASVSGADSYTAAAASYTLTVNAVTAPTETGEQILVASLTEVPEGLQSLYSTVEELQADLFARVSITSSAYTEDNVVYYDVKLQLWNGTTGQWEDATEEDFPAEGITVTLPYPDRTDSSYDFVVVHMFTETSTRLGITAGETETPAVTKTDDGLTVTLKGLSPVAVAWKEADTAATVTVTPAATATAPSTGDASTPLLWLALLTLCGAGLGLVAGKRKRTR